MDESKHKRRRFRFSVKSLMIVMVVVGFGCAMWRWFDIDGVLYTFDILVALIAWANLARVRQDSPIWIPKLSVVEILACCFVCLVLHFITYPRFQSENPSRGATPPSKAQPQQAADEAQKAPQQPIKDP